MKGLETRVVSHIKVGDVFVSYNGTKPRPHIVLKVGSKCVLSCACTTTKDHLFVCEINSRYEAWKYVAANVGLNPISYARKNVIGAIDNDKEIPRIISKLKEKLTI